MFKFLKPFLRPGAPHPLHPAVQQDDDQTFRVRVRTARHGEVVEFRFTKSAHIAVDDDGNLFFRKPVVSPRHLDRGELLVQFDRAYRVTAVSGEGVELVPVAEWTETQAP
ncbi:hypothetical protein [Deinococcus wulumuqiensis]|uniref:hypothetical protein n=1 Tax=Deinococcus wulumuqiensis TaxID=980427 RepID=UPI00242BFBD6|nr:hypothetical protein [Deinococcus wulumuqiensis]